MPPTWGGLNAHHIGSWHSFLHGIAVVAVTSVPAIPTAVAVQRDQIKQITKQGQSYNSDRVQEMISECVDKATGINMGTTKEVLCLWICHFKNKGLVLSVLVAADNGMNGGMEDDLD